MRSASGNRKRRIENYIGLHSKPGLRTMKANLRFSNSPILNGGNPSVPHRDLLHSIKDFVLSWFDWFKHTGFGPSPVAYPKSHSNSTHTLMNKTGAANDIVLAIAADWATDTIQAEAIGILMGDKKPDYTIHLGDTYYTGSKDEINDNFLDPQKKIWPSGSCGTFALLGNHEMYSKGEFYMGMIKGNYSSSFGVCVQHKYQNQEAPFFCLQNDNWCILGLDTGYQSISGIHLPPDNTDLKLPDELINWLRDKQNGPNLSKKGIVILTHHQYTSAFEDDLCFMNPANQLSEFIDSDKEVIWLWGHEHRFSMYDKYQQPTSNGKKYITAHGRCIGNGSMPIEIDKTAVDSSRASTYKLVLYDNRKAATLDSGTNVGFNGYALLNLKDRDLEILYYTSYYDNNTDNLTEQLVIKELWQTDNNGNISNVAIIDGTAAVSGKSSLTYYGKFSPPINLKSQII